MRPSMERQGSGSLEMLSVRGVGQASPAGPG